MRIFVLLGIVLCLASVAHAAQGNAVFYKPPYIPSACYGNCNDGTMVTGIANPDAGNIIADYTPV
ncbi:hypothetical protein Patl1_14411 [Pistacia atlantica]|uniref:Uncharacterized protein n=1 Tax=Pistacia atlantica TaxID=434234 RepID=A0ACC1ASZ3_9ROSI|nr:hypothetical protein Patl1_14411 [Pistacia atlantica]